MSVLVEYCNKLKNEGSKGRGKQVVGGFVLRGGPTSTRSRVCIVGRLCSCLGVLAVLGMDDRDYGSGYCKKRGVLIEIWRDIVV